MTRSEVDSALDKMFSELLNSAGAQTTADPHPEVTSPLYPHQRQALAWMMQRENGDALPPFWEETQGVGGTRAYRNTLVNFVTTAPPTPIRGGILADDMGLGKTLSIIALIATNRPGVDAPRLDAADASAGDGGAGTSSAAAAVAAAATPRPAKRRPSRKRKATQLDVPEGAPAAAPPPPAVPTGPRATLLVVPLSVLSNWQQQLSDHTAGNLQVVTYHGPERNRSPAFLARHDLVLTTYATLAGDMGARNGLLKVHWLRVVLDEGHQVRNARSQQAQAARSLNTERRWLVTGTPIQNNIRDMYGLLLFLGLDPLTDRSIYTRTLERPLKRGNPSAIVALRVLLGALALRRTKESRDPVTGAALVPLPPKAIHQVTVALPPGEREQYKRLEAQVRDTVQRYDAEGTLLSNYTTILALILRLRQVCDSSALCSDALAALAEAAAAVAAAPRGAPLPPGVREKLLAALQAAAEADECPVCLCPFTCPVITRCCHVYCRGCIERVVQAAPPPRCPLCRADVAPADLLEPPPPPAEASQGEGEEGAAGAGGRSVGGKGGEDVGEPSAKIVALIAKLEEVAAESAPDERPIKSVVFSQFTGMLDLVAAALEEAGVPFVRLDGSTAVRARAECVRSFQAPDGPIVFLSSLKAGGVGLNLTAANHVHLLDPWWNPAVEDQAMDRVHRLGQARPVSVWRYIAQATIEERMLLMHERKRALAAAAFEVRTTGEALRVARAQDLRLLIDV